MTADPSVPAGSVYLGRIDPNVYPASQVYFIDTAMGAQIAPAGWLLNNADCAKGGELQFAEYHSTDLNGAPLTTDGRLSCSRQLTPAQAALWSDPTTVLSGWDPTRPAGPRPRSTPSTRTSPSPTPTSPRPGRTSPRPPLRARSPPR